MLVTQVEMLLWHADQAEMAKMLEWLESDGAFLFDQHARERYGLGGTGRWFRSCVWVDTACRTGAYIDWRFALSTYGYPHALAHAVGRGGWKIKARWREQQVATGATWETVPAFRGPWTELSDEGFPLWGPGADRARQAGGRGLGRKLAELRGMA